MASSSPDFNVTRAKDLGKYTANEPLDGRPHEKSRVLAAEDVDIMRICDGCGKQMAKVKSNLVCSCKKTIHCSKACLKTSRHKCEASHEEPSIGNEKSARHEKVEEVISACRQHYYADREANQGPSSNKITWLLKATSRDPRRILKYAERGHPVASYLVGSAYAERDFDQKDGFAIPSKYKAQSVAETNEIAVKWLMVAAEGGVPEAMFLMFITMISEGGLRVDYRVAYYWLVKAHASGNMEYLIQMLEAPMFSNFASSLNVLLNQIEANVLLLNSQLLAGLLMATRYRELKTWDGKTAMGEPFYGHATFKSIMESIGEIDNVPMMTNFIEGKKKKVLVIPSRPGYSDFTDKYFQLRREENNLKFSQGVKEKNNPDYQLVSQTSNVEGRTSYMIACKHDIANIKYLERENVHVNYDKEKDVVITSTNPVDLKDYIKRHKEAGTCEPCVQEASQRVRAVNLGHFSISLFPEFDRNLYAARYSTEDGVIVQDVFLGYSKPFMRQMLQCLMSTPADLHPLAVAEDANLFWPIIWFWGSVYGAVQDACDEATLGAIYGSLGQNINISKNGNASAMAAFPEAAAGEWRIACGSEMCPRVDHEVKFNLCAGCKVRRYCDAVCQKEDRPKHIKFCTAAKKQK